jgi:putative PIN family toxin of toxin-antitoxin system
MRKKRIILDTNLWISFLISNKLNALDFFLKENKVLFLYSSHLIEEIENVVKRPKFKKYFSENSLNLMQELFQNYGITINVTSNNSICRDPKDDFLLNLAIDGNADYILTGDKDLLVLEKIGTTKIISFSEFISKNK